ncbi:MAG: ABC transporter ATP-binding protein [Candidatus Bathyarchaeia archaeon]|nr:ABC transporter ATP-binding protein [Candidatus Bathyarchaeota archaeon]
MLTLKNVSVSYDGAIALKDVSLKIADKGIIAIVGPNGSGKSTLLKTIAGILRPRSGEIEFMGKRIDKLPSHEIVKLGIILVPEGRLLFPAMTVLENLLMGAYTISDRNELKSRLNYVFELFPILKERRRQLAGTLSGGEQQMLAIGRGLMSNPKLLMIDEPSTGLAPKLVSRIFNVIQELKNKGITTLLVEQNIYGALKMADQAYVIEEGRIIMGGSGREILTNEYIKRVYLTL